MILGKSQAKSDLLPLPCLDTKFGELSKSAQNAILVQLSWELVQNDPLMSANRFLKKFCRITSWEISKIIFFKKCQNLQVGTFFSNILFRMDFYTLILFNQGVQIKLSTSSKNLEGPNCIHDQNFGRLWSGYNQKFRLIFRNHDFRISLQIGQYGSEWESQLAWSPRWGLRQNHYKKIWKYRF